MVTQTNQHPPEIYQINTPVYKGPLDLLLQLIEHAELDITTLALAQVTDEYLAHIHNLSNQKPSEISAFLVIAAKLLQIKSIALLPRPPLPGQDVEEDFGEQLIQQLIQYRKFKKVAVFLEEQESDEKKTFLRLLSSPIIIEPKFDLSGISLNDLIEAGNQIFSNKTNFISLNEVVNLPRVTIRERIHTILDELRMKNTSSFGRLIKSWSRVEIVVTFLALLELVKRHFIEVQQEFPFDDIKMKSLSNIQTEDEIQIEFED